MPLKVVEKPGTEICWGAGGNQESCFVHTKFEMLIRHTKVVAKYSSPYIFIFVRSSSGPPSEMFSLFYSQINELGSAVFKSTKKL